MKKVLQLSLLLIFTFAMAQNEEKNTSFNNWSLELNGGLSKPTAPFETGYYVDDFSFFHVDLGARYMFNSKFGTKLDFGYDSFENAESAGKFEGKYYRVNLQGVMNLGRILNFEDFAPKLNFQLHAGPGYSYMESNNFKGKDEMINFLVGLGAQYKLSNRVALNADFSMINNIRQTYSFDGTSPLGQVAQDRGFNGTLYNATLGLSFYLGKNENHADWSFNIQKDILGELESRIAEMETMMNDTDRDGVPDYLDTENNTMAGVAVDSKGRAVDFNKNGVPDELERYVDNKVIGSTTSTPSTTSSVAKTAKELINEGYINIYFDTNSHYPKNSSADDIYFMVNYLKSNPTATAEIIGYADARGNTDANMDLSKRRAERVKLIMEKAGIDAGRMSIVPQGEDDSVNKDSKDALSLVRKVTFRVK